MKLRHILYYIALSILAFQPSIAPAENSFRLQGFDSLQTGSAAYAEAQKTRVASKHIDELFHHSGDPIGGNDNGKITLVEFFDYRCSHCAAMSPIIHAIIRKNADVRIVYKEYPILGKLSVYAAKAALAANNQGKYLEFHDALMESDHLDESKVLRLAKSLGLDLEKLKTDMDSVAIEEEIRSNYQLARAIGIFGTPTFYITQTNTDDPTYLISGEVEQNYLQNLIGRLNR